MLTNILSSVMNPSVSRVPLLMVISRTATLRPWPVVTGVGRSTFFGAPFCARSAADGDPTLTVVADHDRMVQALSKLADDLLMRERGSVSLASMASACEAR